MSIEDNEKTIIRLTYELEELQEKYDILKKMTLGNAKVKLDKHKIFNIKRGLIPINLNLVKEMNKGDLMLVVLQREAYINERMNEMDKSIRNNDRELFKYLREEIDELKELLSKEEQYKLYLKTKQELQEMTREKNYYALQLATTKTNLLELKKRLKDEL